MLLLHIVLDYGNATLAGIPLYLLKQLQLVMNSAARLVFSSSRYHHITPLLRQPHWLKARERIVFKCQHGAAPSYLADERNQPADFEAQRRLRSALSPSLITGTRRTRLSTIGDRAFPVAAARVWRVTITVCLPQSPKDTRPPYRCFYP